MLVGPIVRIAPNSYSIDDADAIKTIYGHGTHFVKGKWYIASGNPKNENPDIFTELNPHAHAENRRKVASLYSMSSLVPMEQNAIDCAKILVDRFTAFAERRISFNLQGACPRAETSFSILCVC
jgi:hypothetical protein